jgi:branched-chain amino acid transport system substrate-binding protein
MDAESLPDTDAQKSIILKYQRDFSGRYKEMPIMFGANAYDAVQIVVAALQKAGPDKEKIRDAIEKTRNFIGASGVYNFSPAKHSPDLEGSIMMYKVANRKWVIAR